MKNLTTLAAVAALALGFAVNDAAAHHGKGSHVGGSGSGAFQNTVEAPFLENNEECLNSLDTGMCDNSIGKIGSGGSYKVHIRGVFNDGNEFFKLCVNVNGTPIFIAEDEIPEEGGDLNYTGNLFDPPVSVADAERWEAPFFEIFSDPSTRSDCDGTPAFIQGVTFSSPAAP